MTIDFGIITPSYLSFFGEPGTYVKASGATRNITLIAVRGARETIPETPSGLRPFVTIHVANSATTGISASELDCGADHIHIPPRVGGTAEDMTITRIIQQDAAMLQLECR